MESTDTEVLAARVREELARTGRDTVRTEYVAERGVLRLTWATVNGQVTEDGVEFPATPDWVARMLPVLQRWGTSGAAPSGGRSARRRRSRAR